MVERRSRRLARRLALALVIVLLASPALDAQAQLCLLGCPTPKPAPTPSPAPTPEPPPPSAPPPSNAPAPTATPQQSASPDPEESPPGALPGFPAPWPPDDSEGPPFDEPGGLPPEVESSELPPGLEEPLHVPSIPRTRPRNTVELVRLLEPLSELGIPLEQVLLEGMGRFPVAGLAYYSDDWLNPRYTPTPHLHQGLDIFADFGTPIRAPVSGSVSRLSNSGAGGVGVWLAGSDGSSYYFAHLLELAEGLRAGQSVEVGTLLGYVGDTGNARGGAPHLHLEVHRGGPTPPKPIVDGWLDDALEAAPGWVQEQRARILDAKDLLDGGTGGLGEIETSMLLTLLDPIGGSVGMLPSLNIAPRRTSGLSDGLVAELIRNRVEGNLLNPSSRYVNLRDYVPAEP